MAAPGADSDSVIVNPLRAAGVIDAAGLDRARAYQMQNGGPLSDSLLRLNVVRESEFLRVFAELYSTQFVKADTLRTLKISDELLERVGVRASERLRMCALRWEQERGELHVVAAVPLSANLEPELRQIVGARSVVVYVATPGTVAALIRRVFYRDDEAFSLVTPNGAGPSLPARGETTEIAAEPSAPNEITGVDGKVIANIDELTVTTLRRENARYRIAQEFHRRVSLERSFEQMIDRILWVIFELMNADGAAIWLTTGQFASKSKSGTKKLAVPRAVIDEAMGSETGILTHNALVDERFGRSESMMVRGVQSVMAVRIAARSGPPLGILYVESTSQRAAFTEEDLSLLDSITAQAAILIDNVALVAQVKQEVENRVNLSRFLSPAAVEEVLSGRMNLKLEGAAAEVTVLYVDIRGFTKLSSKMPPEEIVRFLNSFFGEAVDAIEKHHGVVDKFIGDCVMAIWGVPEPREDDARNALRAALELMERASRIQVNGIPLKIGIGLNTGLAVVGAIGSKNRLDFTAIGATVNIAARLCGVANGGEVLSTSETLMRAGPGVFSEVRPPVVLKGLDTPTVPHLVKGVREPVKLIQLVQPIQLQQTVAPIPLQLVAPVKAR